MRIIVLDVGQGDATLLLSPENEAVLIDTGPPVTGPKAVRSVLEEQGVKEISRIFISHHHLDHAGGLDALLQAGWVSMENVIDKYNVVIGRRIPLGPAHIEITGGAGWIGQIPPPPDVGEDENSMSLALLVEYGGFRYFTDGDLPGGGGNPPYQTFDFESLLAPRVGDVDVILVPHHGSHTSTNQNFLDTLKPEVGIISVGVNNDYYHPHPSVLERLRKAGVIVHQTMQEGSICIVTNGETYFVKPYAVDKCAPPL